MQISNQYSAQLGKTMLSLDLYYAQLCLDKLASTKSQEYENAVQQVQKTTIAYYQFIHDNAEWFI
jgi:hypothetical protein